MRLTLVLMNKLLTATAAFVLAAGFPAAAQHQPPPQHRQHSSDHAAITGNWKLSTESRHGKLNGFFRIKQEGSKLSGTCEVEGHGVKQMSGTIDGKKVTLSVPFDEGKMTLTFTGTVDGEKMSGSTDLAGPWTASRETKGNQ
jgi:hypothetical protein